MAGLGASRAKWVKIADVVSMSQAKAAEEGFAVKKEVCQEALAILANLGILSCCSTGLVKFKVEPLPLPGET